MDLTEFYVMLYKMKYSSYLAALAVLFTAACAKEEIADKQQPVLPEDAVSFSGAMEQGGAEGNLLRHYPYFV